MSPPSNPLKIVYLGFNTSYYQTIEDYFKTFCPDQKIDFYRLTPVEHSELYHFFSDILHITPHVIYLDFTEEIETMRLLGNFLKGDRFFTSIPIVGIFNTKDESYSLGLGLDFIFVKGGEIQDAIYFPLFLTRPELIKKPKYARTILKQKTEMMSEVKINLITSNMAYVEGDLFFKEGEGVALDSPQKTKQSIDFLDKQFRVKSIKTDGLYDNYLYRYTLEFVFTQDSKNIVIDYERTLKQELNEVKKIRMIKEMKRKMRVQEREYSEERRRRYKKHERWLREKREESAPHKKSKVLIIDKRMRIFKEGSLEQFSNLPFSLHTQTFLEEEFDILEKIRPDVIALEFMSDFDMSLDKVYDFQFDEIIKQNLKYKILSKESGQNKEIVEEIRLKRQSELSEIAKMIQKIKSMDHYTPIVILFRGRYLKSESLQKNYSYPFLLVYENSIQLDSLTNLVGIYERKRGGSHFKDIEGAHYFVSPNDPLRFCLIKNQIEIRTLTENEITFFSHLELETFHFRMDFPVRMRVHLVPISEDCFFVERKGKKLYWGLLHGMSEDDKKKLRRYVNETYSDLLQEEIQEEMEYWRELKEKQGEDYPEVG